MTSAITDETWEAIGLLVADSAAPRGGADERGERLRRAAHELFGPFVSTETWQIVRELIRYPEPIVRVVVAVAQILTANLYSTTPRDRARRARILKALLDEAEVLSAERRAA